MNEKMSDETFINLMANIALVLIIGLLITFAYFTAFNPVSFAQDFVSLFLGNVGTVSLNLGQSLATILQMTLVSVSVALVSSFFMHKGKSFKIDELKKLLEHPKLIYTTILLEELFRWAIVVWFGGVVHAGPWLIIILILIANFLWGIYHLTNYKDPADRKLSAVLPQLAQGLIYSYILVRYGFWIALFTHFTMDAVIFSSLKTQMSFGTNFWKFTYWLVIGIVTWLIMSHFGFTFGALAPWLSSTTSLNSISVGFWEMVVLITFIDAITGTISNLLDLDNIGEAKIFKDISFLKMLGYLAGAVAFVLLFAMGISWLLSWLSVKLVWLAFLGTPLVNAIATSLIINILLVSPKSGSAMARSWFFSVPSTFITVFTLISFGFLPALGILCANGLISFIPLLIEGS